MEHHSNDLPWRRRASVVRAGVTREGRLDEDARRPAARRVRRAHRAADRQRRFERDRLRPADPSSGAKGPRGRGAGFSSMRRSWRRTARIDVKPDDDPEHLDFVALSAHKMYAPFGTGALVGRRDIFLEAQPEHQGGGTVEIVTPTEVHWAGLPDREEAGSPNVVGAVAMAVAAQALMERRHGPHRAARGRADRPRARAATVASRRHRLRTVRSSRRTSDRVGVITFNVRGVAPRAGCGHPRLRGGDWGAERLFLRAILCRASAGAHGIRTGPLATRTSRRRSIADDPAWSA